MNYSKDQEIRDVCDSIGDFIRYWGFRRVHGQVWALLYLKARPMSAVQMSEFLGVSKALLSPAIAELQDFKLIQYEGGDGKTKLFSANTNVTDVIQQILSNREQKLIEHADGAIDKLIKNKNGGVDSSRASALLEMTRSAKTILALIQSGLQS